ncbi:MAG TPA: helix-turn-helix domain-containing protein [Candidatus Woesebacteria bacterium]|nr:helix-turn-helix domain-containing protein [Candidatus Woesebacteria bacterium]
MLDWFSDIFLSKMSEMWYIKMMFDRLEKITTEQYQKLSKKWRSLLEIGESVAVIFPYMSDRQIRFSQYLEESSKDEILIPINLEIQWFDDLEDLKKYIETQAKNYKIAKTVTLVMSNGDELFKPQNIQIMKLLQRLMLDEKNIRLLSAFETDVLKKINNIHEYNLLFQNIVYYPLYNLDDTFLFVDYLCKKWQIKMPQPIRKSIVYNGGGSFWLVKESCRSYRDKGKWTTEDEGFLFRINLISKAFSEKEKEIILAAPYLKSYELLDEFKHLKKIGLIDKNDRVIIPLLTKIIEKEKIRKNLLEIEDGEVFFRGISLMEVMSPTEYVILKCLMKKANNPVDRDEIAKIIWPEKTEEYYSQWAIDQSIKRLRSRLKALSLPSKIIASIRGVGYEYRTI